MQEVDKNSIRNRAALAGAVLGVISGGYIFASFGLATSMAGAAVTWIYWLAKLIGCIWIMRWFMLRFCDDFPQADNVDARKFGTLAALYSAIITAACSYIAMEYVFPGEVQEQLSTAMDTFGAILDSNTMAMMEKMEGRLAAINAVTTLVWCFFYGWILSIILSSRIPAINHFTDSGEEDESDDEQ